MRGIAVLAIRLYQRHLSPRKGFCCAYRVHTGRRGCSMLGLRAIRRYGVLPGLLVLRRRLELCGIAHRRMAPIALRRQAGFCDAGCDLPCDMSGIDGCVSIADAASFCDCSNCGGCDWTSSKKRKSDEEQYVYIPPNSMRPPPPG
jgi:putative component of membrane protein insertase Oxa1/YidC/SpoIIIJ protein YidD